MNKAIIMCRLSADPELRKTESGISSCRFTVAVQEDYKNKDGSRDVDFINCKAWRSTAEYVSQNFKKGSRIAVIGKNKCDVYDKNGEKQYYYYIKAESVEFEVLYEGKKSDKITLEEAQIYQKRYPMLLQVFSYWMLSYIFI